MCLPEGYTQYYEKDLSWHKSQSLHRRCGGGGEMNYSTSELCSALTSCCVLWGGEGSRQQQAAPPHKAAVTWQPQDRASKEPRFSRGQGIISESSSRIIAPSQNDSHRCGTPSQIAGLSFPTHTGWNDSPAPLIARHLSLRISVPSGLARLWCYYTIAVQYSALRVTTCCWGDLLKLSVCVAEKMEGCKKKERNCNASFIL